jgi:antitoxin-like ribbon-helix-helix protein
MPPKRKAAKPAQPPAAPARRAGRATRKLIEFDPETWMALDLLAQDRMATVQELADEAFADLLKKHHRPVTLKEALRQSKSAK